MNLFICSTNISQGPPPSRSDAGTQHQDTLPALEELMVSWEEQMRTIHADNKIDGVTSVKRAKKRVRDDVRGILISLG